MKQPKYEIIKQDIIEKINTGEFEPGTVCIIKRDK